MRRKPEVCKIIRFIKTERKRYKKKISIDYDLLFFVGFAKKNIFNISKISFYKLKVSIAAN